MGVVIFAVGIALLLFTFYEAYGIYVVAKASIGSVQASQQNSGSAAMQSGQLNSSTQLASTLANDIVNGIFSRMPIDKYAAEFVTVVLLYVFASIGFKISRLGIYLILEDENDVRKAER